MKAKARPRRQRVTLAACWIAATGVLGGCGDEGDMLEQPYYRTMRSAPFFADGTAVRPRIPGTVPFRAEPRDAGLAMDRTHPLNRAYLQRGQNLFQAYCALCHGLDGSGEGIIVRRGFPPAATYHSDRLRNVDDNYIFNVITNGYNEMPPHGWIVAEQDRWNIVHYVRLLQFSRHAPLDALPENLKEQARTLTEDRTP